MREMRETKLTILNVNECRSGLQHVAVAVCSSGRRETDLIESSVDRRKEGDELFFRKCKIPFELGLFFAESQFC
jgi:hypothetical protein